MEEKSYYELWPVLPYEKNEKYEYEMYNSCMFNRSDNRNQLRFTLSFESIEEWLLGMSYLIGRGWYNSMKFAYSLIPTLKKEDGTPAYHWVEARKQRVRERACDITVDNFKQVVDFDGRLVIDIVINYNRLEEFRNSLKEWPGFSTMWLSPDCKWSSQDNNYFIK